jgi:UDP-N-acetylmuramate--alanine ligase
MTADPTAPAAVPTAPLDLSRPGRYHVVGVGGPGMSAIAIVLAQMGHATSGSDLRDVPVLERLRAEGVTVHVGHDDAHVAGADAVTASTAIPPHNLELRAAHDRGIRVLRRAGMLASICAQARAVAVAGTHGKTTTTSMLALVMAEAGWRPSFVIGGDVTDMGTGAQWTGGEWFVVEADESDGTHLELPLHATILTNVEADHLDHYGSFEGIVEGFERYLDGIEGPKVLCGDDPVCARLAAERDRGAVTYGTGEGVDYRAVDIEVGRGSFRFVVERRTDGGVERLGKVVLPLRGLHNVRNATGVVAMSTELGIAFADVVAALGRFGGVARRFDFRGAHGGATLVDDYAHLPSEIDAVLSAARGSGDGWRRIVAVFQPNRYHRVALLWRDYATAFRSADVVVLTDIYSSGTTPIPGVTGKLLVNAVTETDPTTRVVWLPRRHDLVEFLARELRDGDVCISMGCGDIATLPDEVLERRIELGGPTP